MTKVPHGEYPEGWKEFAIAVKEAAGWRCIRCGHPHDRESGHVLTVHHLTNNKAEPFAHWWAFLALCQRCHLSIQARVDTDRPWIMQEHTDWFKPYVGGLYAYKYLGGMIVPRPIVERYINFFVLIERDMLQGGMTQAAMMARFKFVVEYEAELAEDGGLTWECVCEKIAEAE